MINFSLASSSIRKYQMKLVGDRFRISTVHLIIPVMFWNSVAKQCLCSNFSPRQLKNSEKKNLHSKLKVMLDCLAEKAEKIITSNDHQHFISSTELDTKPALVKPQFSP